MLALPTIGKDMDFIMNPDNTITFVTNNNSTGTLDGPKPDLNNLAAEKNDPGILENIRCSKCTKYYFSPIFLCPKGHNLCNHCEQKINLCKETVPNAGTPFSFGTTTSFDSVHPSTNNTSVFSSRVKTEPSFNPKNYFCGRCNGFFPVNRELRSAAREKSIKILNFPCGNASNKCPYRNTLSLIEKHEQMCIFANRSCFFTGCDWKGSTKEMIDHSKEKHTPIIPKNTHFLSEGINIYPIHSQDKFFLLRTSYVLCGSLKFSVLYPDEGIRYKFEIQLMGYNNDIGLRLSNYCEPLLNGLEMKDMLDEITLPFDCLKCFVTDFEKIRFNIDIAKV